MDVGVLLLQYLSKASPRLSQQRRLYDALRTAILDGRLAAGARLPASRALAEELQVARNSVVYAYERLVDEGVIVADRRGSRVSRHLPRPESTPDAPHVPSNDLAKRVDGLAGRRVTGKEAMSASFVPGTPALDAFPLAQWRTCIERAWRRVAVHDLGYGESAGQPRLRQAIADYLRVSRGVRCTPDQVFITDGTQSSLALCATLLADPGDRVWIENPGHIGARSAFQSAALLLTPVATDDHGLMWCDDDWQRLPPKLIYLTPSHQYPLGSVLSIHRRLGLIDAARTHRAWIIEDDYDSEFRHDGLPLPAVQGLSDHAPVVYLGTFSKTLFPALRIGFMVVPAALRQAFSDTLSAVSRQGRVTDQLALADFIESGAYSRHIRKMRRIYSARRDALRDGLQRHLGHRLSISGGAGGMHLSVRFTVPVSDRRVCAVAAAAGLTLAPLSDYDLNDVGHSSGEAYSTGTLSRHSGLVLGYAGMPVEAVDDHVRQLARAIDKAILDGESMNCHEAGHEAGNEAGNEADQAQTAGATNGTRHAGVSRPLRRRPHARGPDDCAPTNA